MAKSAAALKSRLDDRTLLSDIAACPAWARLRGAALLNL